MDIFLECLITGPVSLYKANKIFYIENADTIISLAVEQKQIERDTGVKSTMFMKKHVGILRYLFIDCKSLSQKINKIVLNEKSLVKIVKEYNECISSPFNNTPSYTEYKTSKPGIKVNFGVIGGPVYHKLDNLAEYNSYLNNPDIGGATASNLTYTFGANLYLSLPRRLPKFSLISGCYYLPANFDTDYSYERNNIKYYTYVTIRNKILKFPIGVQWITPWNKINGILNFGFSFSKYIDKSYSAIIETEDTNNVIKSRELDLEFADPKTGIWLGTGISKSLSDDLQGFVELRIEADDNDFLSHSHNELLIYLIIGVKFVKAN